MTQKEKTEITKQSDSSIQQVTKKTPPRKELRTTAETIDPQYFIMLEKIQGILAKGNNVEVRGSKNGPLVMEVRKTIIQ